MDEQAETKKRRGRPPKSAEDRKAGNLTFRVRDGMRERLEASAKARGLSISEDVEKRIERTFDFDYLLGDNETALVLRSIANAVQRFEQASGNPWVRDSETQERVHEAVSKMVDVLLGVRQQNDDRKSTGVGLPVDWDDAHQRLRARLFALEIGAEELQSYIKEKEAEYLPVMREARGKSRYKVEVTRVRSILAQADWDQLADIAASLVLIEGEARVVQTQAGVVVSEQGLDGLWRPVPPVWHGSGAPPWSADTEAELRARIERMLSLPPAPTAAVTRPATPEEIAVMKPARGQLPPEIGDRALFDDAVSGLPLVKAETAADPFRRGPRRMFPDDPEPRDPLKPRTVRRNLKVNT